MGGGDAKSVWWNDEIKTAVRRKEATWNGVLAAGDEEAKKRCMDAYKEEKRRERLNGLYIRAKRK